MDKLTDRRREYRETYLRSDHWRQMRALALEDAEHSCAVCCGKKSLDVHHRTYERIGAERLTDLLVLCRQCHTIFHEHGRLAGSQPRPSKKARGKKKKATNNYLRNYVAKGQKPSKPDPAVVTVGAVNDRLHRIQQRNKQQQKIAARARASLGEAA